MFISLLTDFGSTTEYSGVVKAVILSVCPGVTLVDISHNVPSYDIDTGWLMLANFVKYSPQGIHVVVIDPGVGTDRRGIAVETKRGDVLIGPDNGVLMGAVNVLHFRRAFVLENEQYMLEHVSASFHGRDVFAPAAGHIACGVPLEEFGRELTYNQLTSVGIPAIKEDEKAVYGTVLRIDGFGNIQTTINAGYVPKKAELTIHIEDTELELPYVTTFGDVNPGELLVYTDSDGLLTISQNQGSARDLLEVEKGVPVTIFK
ncbi:MAG: SAM-dependent chlorinase/fluorinase [Candidatus Methanofastidiosia archaeon]|jgi:S-adenosylmethionine hydrolase